MMGNPASSSGGGRKVVPAPRAIFDWIYGLLPQAVDYELEFEAVPDQGMPPEWLRARREKERQSLAALQATAAGIKTIRACHEWLFTRHDAYNASRSGFRALASGEHLLESY